MTFPTEPKPPPNYAPVYAAALYPELATLARQHGYALAVHGSLRRDFDLVAIPWADSPSEPEIVLKSITGKFAIRLLGDATEKPHGRKAWTVSIGHGECALDISFMPILTATRGDNVEGDTGVMEWADV